jgi:hypothetical protein
MVNCCIMTLRTSHCVLIPALTGRAASTNGETRWSRDKRYALARKDVRSAVPGCQFTAPWLELVRLVAGWNVGHAYLTFCSAWHRSVLASSGAEEALLMNLRLQFFRPHDAPQRSS